MFYNLIINDAKQQSFESCAKNVLNNEKVLRKLLF